MEGIRQILKRILKLSIASKVTALVVTFVCLATLCASTVLILANVDRQVTDHVTAAESLAQLFAQACNDALADNDPEAARDRIELLAWNPMVTAVHVFRRDGSLLASFSLDQSDPAPPDKTLPPPTADGSLRTPQGIDSFARVSHHGELVGTVLVQTRQPSTWAGINTMVAVAAASVIVISLLAWLAAFRLQRFILKPLRELAGIVKHVSLNKDYTIRARRYADDEIGFLISKFNEMLEEIQSRDDTIHRAYVDLEQRIRERTRELRREVAERLRSEENQMARLTRSKRQQTAVIRLLSNPSIIEGNLGGAVAIVTEAAAGAVEVERCSVWLRDDDNQLLKCVNTYTATTKRHSVGPELDLSQCRRHLAALEAERAIASDEIYSDEQIKEFIEARVYEDTGVNSVLNAAIWVAGSIKGFISLEHVGFSRQWTDDEVAFAGELADQVSQSMVNRDRIQAIAAVRESEAKYRTLFDTANDAIFLMANDMFIDCNAQTLDMFACTREQIIGHPPYEYSPERQPDNRLSQDKAMEKITAALNGEPQFFEWRHCQHDKTEFDAEVSLNRMEVDGDVFLLAVVRDITERKQAEEHHLRLMEKLDRAQRMESIGVLAGGVAHDLNNMLGPLVAYPDLILRKLPKSSPVRKQVERIGRAAQDAADVIQDLLTLARRGRYEMKPTNLNDVLDAYLDSASHTKLINARPDVLVKYCPDKAIEFILGSAPHLSKVIMNLVVNAVDAMQDGGTLTIETSQEYLSQLYGGHDRVESGEYVILRVRDTGMGIDPDDLDKIFEPYYSKKQMGTSGSGLGLSVVYGIVKDHHGFYDVFSGVGQGTEFVLYFPVTSERRVEHGDATLLGGDETVLVIDDVADQREMAADLLRSLGYTATTAANGRAAVKYMQTHDADILLLDMIMEKDFDGLDTYREICKLHPQQRAVIVSGYSQTDRVSEVLKLGAGRYIRKPYTLDNLGRAVREELDREISPATTTSSPA